MDNLSGSEELTKTVWSRNQGPSGAQIKMIKMCELGHKKQQITLHTDYKSIIWN